jgi:ComF family protein
MWMIHSLINQILKFIYPVTCIGCGSYNTAFCNRCLHNAKRSTTEATTFSLSIFNYKDPIIRNAILKSKFYHRRDLIAPIATFVAHELASLDRDFVIVPIPMTPMRLMMRGYNQAEELSRGLSKHLHLPHREDLLTRTQSTQRQVVAKGRRERRISQKKSFRALPAVTGMRVLLVDDVTTTGSTLIEARSTLLRAGAHEVLAVTIAH